VLSWRGQGLYLPDKALPVLVTFKHSITNNTQAAAMRNSEVGATLAPFSVDHFSFMWRWALLLKYFAMKMDKNAWRVGKIFSL
jgi:hypothetical protein